MSTVYVSRQTLPRNYLTAQNLDVLETPATGFQTITSSGTSVPANATGAAVEDQEIFSVYPVTAGVFAKVGPGTPVAVTAQGNWCPPNTKTRILAKAGDKIAVVD